jgi:alkylation response protein AidB-like acyl-CoA dehydrogenase
MRIDGAGFAAHIGVQYLNGVGMRLQLPAAAEAFRDAAAAWLTAQLTGPFAALRGLRNLTEAIDERRRWEQALGAAGWSCIGWPEACGGRGADLTRQVLFAEEYARAGGPNRIGHIGVELAGPTIIALGTPAQQARLLPAIARGDDIWCQAYSEPEAGSDLANVRTAARLEGGAWVLDGQKVWTSVAQFADWAFVLCRTEPGSRGRQGLSYLLVPMRQAGVVVRPIRQMTGESEFNEVFFDGARTAADNIVGAPGDGWGVAMTTLGFERGVSTLGQQMDFSNELAAIVAVARRNGRARDPVIRQRLADAHIGLRVMRYNALAMLSADGGAVSGAAYCYKLYWASWHRKLGELAMDVVGAEAEIGAEGYRFGALTTMYLSSRADTIYAGTNQIQRNIIAERALGLPREERQGK